MGHRAQVAYEREDGQFNIHNSHWGAGELHDSITPETPLGGTSSEPEYMTSFIAALSSATDEAGLEMKGAATEAQADTDVEREPALVGVSLAEAIEAAPSDLEAFYVVDQAFTVHVFLPIDINMHGYPSDSEILYISPYHYNGEPTGQTRLKGELYGMRQILVHLVREGLSADAARREFLNFLLTEYKFATGGQRILVHSTPITAEHRAEYPSAFVNMRGYDNWDEFVPAYDDIEPWEITEDMDL